MRLSEPRSDTPSAGGDGAESYEQDYFTPLWRPKGTKSFGGALLGEVFFLSTWGRGKAASEWRSKSHAHIVVGYLSFSEGKLQTRYSCHWLSRQKEGANRIKSN